MAFLWDSISVRFTCLVAANRREGRCGVSKFSVARSGVTTVLVCAAAVERQLSCLADCASGYGWMTRRDWWMGSMCVRWEALLR